MATKRWPIKNQKAIAYGYPLRFSQRLGASAVSGQRQAFALHRRGAENAEEDAEKNRGNSGGASLKKLAHNALWRRPAR